MLTTLSHLNSCSPIHHQISVIFLHPNNTTITHSFPQPTITCHFLHYSPGACGTKAHAPWRQCKTHGQYFQITHTHSPCQQLSATSYTLSLEHMDWRHSSWIICYFLYSFPRAHGLKAQEFLEAVQVHGQYSQNNSRRWQITPIPHGTQVIWHKWLIGVTMLDTLFIENCQEHQEHQAEDSYLYIFLDIFIFYLNNKQKKKRVA